MPRILTPKVTVLNGDCREVLKTLADGSINCCVTSPPYFGLRDYGHEGQIGLEPTPDEYVAKLVAVFREVKRVLRDDGTLWLNLGDSYNSFGGVHAGRSDNQVGVGAGQRQWREGSARADGEVRSDGMSRRNRDGTHAPDLKPKDLIGIPWRVAFALQQPYYTGTIQDERDRVWMAAMVDAEGCLFIHKRKAGQSNGQGYERQNDNYAPGLEISNTNEAIIQRCVAIVGKGSVCSQTPEQNDRRKQTIYRWNLRTTECRDVIRELYPHLTAKKHQARLLCGCPSSGADADAAHQSLMSLHNGGTATIDFPAPASMFEPGYYLRQDLIWSKPNPMPESVTDRCTKAHEYIFLLSKSAKYYFDSEAMKEPVAASQVGRVRADKFGGNKGDLVHNSPGSIYRTAGNKSHKYVTAYEASDTEEHRLKAGLMKVADVPWETRNRRSVWTVSTRPYKGAHFATFPPALIEPCILAGCPKFGTVLDPFGGSGTTGQVALSKERSAVLVELNPSYIPLINERIEKV